jgi:universal stress protein A
MSDYAHVMIALDASEDWPRVVVRGLEVAGRAGARLTLLHVVDERALQAGPEAMIPLFGVEDRPVHEVLAMTEPQAAALSGDERLMAFARGFLDTVADEIAQPEAARRVVASPAIADGIVAAAVAEKVDLLVVGAHHRHGLALLVPSPVGGVVHRLPCDLLLVRIP